MTPSMPWSEARAGGAWAGVTDSILLLPLDPISWSPAEADEATYFTLRVWRTICWGGAEAC